MTEVLNMFTQPAVIVILSIALLIVFFIWWLSRKERLAAREVERLKYILETRSSSVPITESSDQEVFSKGSVPAIPDELLKACASQTCVLFTGDGIAAQAGLPSWDAGLRRVLDEGEKLEPDQNWEMLRMALDNGDASRVAEVIRGRISPETLVRICTDIFSEPAPKSSTLHNVLREIPFLGVITTSWDQILETAFARRQPQVLSPRDFQQFGEILREKLFFILKLYGDPRRAGSFLFTPDEYRRAIYENEPFSKFLNSIYGSTTLLFAGGSLEAIEQNFLSGLRIAGQTDQKHFALVPVLPGKSLEAERFQHKYGITLLHYQPTPGYPEILRFFESLRKRVGFRRISAEPASEIVASGIDRIRLENVGSFAQLDLQFNGSCDVLLGNNGCGKSTILKAIALGLCGNDIYTAGTRATDAASRLLRAGCEKGTIDLWIGQQRYTTILLRSTTGVTIKSEQITPLQAGRCVVLGFPPLRGISQQNLNGPTLTEGSPNPEVRDLLPLISGSVDNRLDNLKQWIVNTGVRINSNDAEDRKRHTQLLESFFRVIAELTPDVSCKFKSIDPVTWQITVTTPDGDVPMDSVSQGTSSVFGWLGILLQRLYEIHRNSDEPEKQSALVLVDEIDAHMHPSWQRSVIEAFKRLFPKVQLIVTTHSPLVVSGLLKSEIYILGRVTSDGSSNIVAERPKSDPRGWYSDMVLTSDLFKLETTLPPQIADAVKRYTELASSEYDALTPTKKTEMADLAKVLDIRLPAPQERQRAREAFDLIEAAMRDRLKEVPLEDQKELLQEAKVQLQEIVTQSRRP